MRLWSIHPKYLDPQGLVACWREALLAQKVLLGKTKGYKNHPQLLRFKATKDPLLSISIFLFHLVKEAEKRNYHFDKSKILKLRSSQKKQFIKNKSHISVNKDQLTFEFNHLLKKQKKRSATFFKINKTSKRIQCHPLFKSKKGPIESWEKI